MRPALMAAGFLKEAAGIARLRCCHFQGDGRMAVANTSAYAADNLRRGLAHLCKLAQTRGGAKWN